MKKQVTDLYHHLCPRYGTLTGFGYSSCTSDNTQSGIISLSTSTTLSSTPSCSITANFFWRYAGCLQELCISSILQNFLYIFFLIPEFRRWADCPIPIQLWRHVVTHGTQKQNSHSALSLPLESGRGNVKLAVFNSFSSLSDGSSVCRYVCLFKVLIRVVYMVCT